MSDTAKIEITLYKPNHKPVMGEVINSVTRQGEYCFGIYAGYDLWLDWPVNRLSDVHPSTGIDWWWHLPKVPKEQKQCP